MAAKNTRFKLITTFRLKSAKPGTGRSNRKAKWFRPVLLVGYHTGMRLEEILTLVWDRESRVAGCVDLEKGRVYLPASITKTKQARTVPLSPTVRSVLHDMKQAGGITRISGLVFTKDGKKLDHTYRVVQDICREVGIENFRFHDLRHSAVTNLRAAGVDVETIMKLDARQAHALTPIQHHSRGQAAIPS